MSAAVRAIDCPNCGGSVELRGLGHSLSAVCINCLSVIDPSTPQLKVLQQFQFAERVQPLVPLGSRGSFEGRPFEILGFQVRTITVDGAEYSWHEYLLFNPYAGFRYLSVYNGHWNYIRPVKGLPETPEAAKAICDGVRYRHFQSAEAVTTFAMGEFPWRVKVGDRVKVDDFIAPPFLLSREATDGEVTWSRGEYRAGAEIASAFALRQPLPAATGVFANQPNPHEMGSLWSVSLWLLVLLFAAMLFFSVTAGGDRVFHNSYTYSGRNAEDAVTTPVFSVGGAARNLEIATRTDIGNDWIYLNMSLVNADTGQAWNFGREIDWDSGEGSRNDSVTVPGVPAGRYFLRIEPEMAPSNATLLARAVHYDIDIRRNVPRYWIFWLAVPFLLLPPFGRILTRQGFETRRWQESDYASS